MIKKILISGNKALSEKDLAPILSRYEGKEVTLDDLKEAARQIEGKYREKGYFLAVAYVPPQEIRDGTAQINILEGRLGEVEVEGNAYHSASYIRRHFNPTDENGVIRHDYYQRSMLLLNELPDIKAQSVLQPGKSPGTTDVVLNVQDQRPFHVGMDYNNYGAPRTGENRAGLSLSSGSLLSEGDYLFLRGVYPFPTTSGTPLYQLSFAFPQTGRGTRVAVSYATAEMRVGRELTILDIRGAAQIYGITASHPLRRTLSDTSDIVFSFFFKSFSNYILGAPFSRDELRMLAAGYNTGWNTHNARNSLSFTLTQGLGAAFGGVKNDESQSSRAGAGNSFTKIDLDLVRLQRVGPDHFLILRGAGRLAANPLVVGEQFYLGGADTVRGYTQSEVLGDSGYFVSGEYRMPLHEWRSGKAQGAIFLDHGSVSLKNPSAGQTPERSLSGGGIGIRIGIGERTGLRLDWGFPFSGANSTHQPFILYGQASTSF